ncbi:MAG: hypothetical protein Fur0018_20920 [Anaerolineales bacterium]
MSRLSRFADGLMEAAWLAVLLGTPVFFNVYSSRIFEPDKITLLRSLAWLALAAWGIKWLSQGGARWQRISRDRSVWRTLTGIPLVVPVAALFVVYLLATLFSVAPRTSLWGSYQRLQGMYTTTAYLVFFAVIAGNLRQRAQVERIFSIVILSSLAVSLYGVLQHYGLDPVPWGGNVQKRIAANMGNSIFVAAYLIMAVPLTIARVIESMRAILREEDPSVTRHILRATLYIFTLALQFIGIYFSGSRGPFLGLAAGLFVFFLLVALRTRQRWLTLGTIGAAVAGIIFLGALNIPNGPFESLRNSPWVGRFGHLADTDQRTSKVRQYIWEGASQLVRPHEPIGFPDGSSDRWNVLRPLIGYGPESMYVAYNRFYPPELGQVEKRNASPDRSHNETWDALVTTGGLGLLVYLLVFGSVFYYGFHWLDLIETPADRNRFIALYLGSGILGAVVLIAWQGIAFLGVGLPLGILAGLVAYITLYALRPNGQRTTSLDWRALMIMSLLTAVLAHFVEIHFGIAIVSTRTHFWIYVATLLVMGHIISPQEVLSAAMGAPAPSGEPAPSEGKRSRSRRARQTPKGDHPSWDGVISAGLLVALYLIVLGFDYISNLQHQSGAFHILWQSFTRLPLKKNVPSYGILGLVFTVGCAAILILASEERRTIAIGFGRAIAVIAGTGFLGGLVYWLWQAGTLSAFAQVAPGTQEELLLQLHNYEGILTQFYFFGLLILLGLALTLPEAQPERRPVQASPWGGLAAPFALLAVMGISAVTNLRVVQADIAFKMADPFTRGDQWPVAMLVYQHAIELAPNEDYYYLFLGRAYLEQAKNLKTVNERRALFLQAEKDLKKAQNLNPLNTDHTANLARLYSWWVSASDDPAERKTYADLSNQYYQKALALSPNNVVLWDEWAVLDLNFLQQPQAALEKLNHALELDDIYDRTYALLGDYYASLARQTQDPAMRQQNLEKSLAYYRQAFDNTPPYEKQSRYLYASAAGNTYIELQQYPEAISAMEQALSVAAAGARWRIEETLARLYVQIQDKPTALQYAQSALADAPQSEQQRLQGLFSQIQGMP